MMLLTVRVTSMFNRNAISAFILMAFLTLPFGGAVLGFCPPIVARTGSSSSIATEGSEAQQRFPAPAQRVLIYPLVLDAYLTLDGGTQHIVGASRPSIDWARRAGFHDIYPEIDHILDIGNSLAPASAEIALLLKPDAVFSWPQFAEPLRQAGVPNLIEVPGSIEHEREALRLVGVISGTLARAEYILERQAEKLRELRANIQLFSPTPQNFLIFGGGVNTQYIAGRTYYLTKKLEFVGLQNAVNTGGSFDLERLMVINPDVLFLDGALNNDSPQTFYRNKAWRALRAVQGGRIYKMPVHSLSNGPVYDPILLRWMTELLFPKQMTSSIRAEIRQMYDAIYGISVDEGGVDKYLLMSANIESTKYSRFASLPNVTGDDPVPMKPASQN
jgi:ABC-type Fe3+-hydroxamate transport system substrate-binding protein